MGISAAYNYVRARQLEGTYERGPHLGVWGITSNRIGFGWGWVDEAVWPEMNIPGHEYGSPEPAGADVFAKVHRTKYYVRVRDSAECRTLLSHNAAIAKEYRKRAGSDPAKLTGIHCVVASFEITRQFIRAPNGLILDPPPNACIVGSHSVALVEDLKGQKAFLLLNSWGQDWGYRGTGQMPYDFFDRWLIEAWSFNQSAPSLPQGTGVLESRWHLTLPTRHVLHGIELYDADADERVGWAFLTERDNYLDVEELFVRPSYRNHGHGGRLAELILHTADHLNRPLRAWISFADCEDENRPALLAIMGRLSLGIRRSGVSWAAYRATGDQPRTDDLPLIRIPARPAQKNEKDRGESDTWETLNGTVLSYEDPFGPALPPDDWEVVP